MELGAIVAVVLVLGVAVYASKKSSIMDIASTSSDPEAIAMRGTPFCEIVSPCYNVSYCLVDCDAAAPHLE